MNRTFKTVLTFVFVVLSTFVLTSCELPENPYEGTDKHFHEYVNGKCECGKQDPYWHVHKYVNGECSCGEKDPNYQEHQHKFVDGKCSCGETDPNYVAPHKHVFVEGKCECGETDPNYQPSEDIRNGYDVITIQEAIKIAQEAGEVPSSEYYVYGIITEISSYLYGAMTIEDETGSIYVYGVYGLDGTRFDTLTEKPAVGDEVVLKATLKTHNGEPEVDKGYLEVFKHNEVEVDDSSYTEHTISEVRDLNLGELVKVTGVVAQVTYAFGYNPNGIYLVDETGSIYVYGAEVAGTVEIGNEVTIIGSKTYYVLESEQGNADKFGYKGCCQIESAKVVSNDKGKHEYNKSWITESTVKDIYETPITENITTNIYKVTALIKKVEGTGFTNYYINDIDGYTGSYVYTACSGGDFAWLDQYDGKICTVYLSPINCKSTSSGCFYRFIPIEVIDEGYKFDETNAPSYALKYHAVDQFLPSYNANPELLVLSTVSSELLGLTDISLSYSSSNPNVIYFEETSEGLVFNTKDPGTSVITITAEYKTYKATATVEITVNELEEYDTITVNDAIQQLDGTTVTVKGVVLSSLVNQTGFYLIDDTGVIAVTTSEEEVKLLSVGDEVVIRGIKSHKIKDGYTGKGQINIYNSTVLVNYYGNHEYSTDLFDKTKDLAYLYGLNVNEDHTTELYVVEAVIQVVEDAHFTTIKIVSVDGATSLSLYCSSANQYSFLKPYNGQKVTLELAMCNWNSKSYYTGCVISVTVDGVKTMNTLNFNG
ncbi:MAG: hypothetical protein IKC22_06385 [Bacilli bacterium]|nr:hypothetical protein [Bacilli bacterium]